MCLWGKGGRVPKFKVIPARGEIIAMLTFGPITEEVWYV